MRVLYTIVLLSLTGLLASCDPQQTAPDIDPGLGFACFESHGLPPGAQYEGIEKLEDNRLTIKAMNGVEVVKLDCVVNPDGTLQDPGE